MLPTLLSQQARSIRRYFAHKTAARVFTAVAFVALIIGLAVGVYVLFYAGFGYIAGYSFADAVSLYMYELLFLTLLGLMFASALISGLLRLFEGRYDAWLMASPRFERLPWFAATTIFASSLWPLVVIGVPALVAMDAVFHVNPLSFACALIALVLFGIFAIYGTLGLLLVAARVVRALGIRRLSRALAILIACSFALGAALYWTELRTISDIAALFPGIGATTGSVSTAAIVSQFQMLPSHAAAILFSAAQGGLVANILLALLELVFLSVGGYALFALAVRGYVPVWQAMQEHSSPVATSLFAGRTFSTSRGPLAVFFEKEFLTFFRSQRNFLWIGFFALLWLLQIGFDVIVSRHFGTDGVAFSATSVSVQMLQVVVIAYFIGMFALRFVFPSFSIEKDTAWIIGSMPISLRRVYLAKLAFFLAGIDTLAVAVVALHSVILGLPLASALVLLLLVVCITSLIVLLGLSLGVLFPDFESSDPEELSTSLPGLTFIASSLIYGGIGALAFRQFLMSGGPLLVAAFIAGSILAGALLLAVSFRALVRFEFAG